MCETGVQSEFTVSLIPPLTTTIISYHDDAGTGTFVPAGPITLNAATPSTVVGYTANEYGNRSVVFTNNRGLPNVTKNVTAKLPIAKTVSWDINLLTPNMGGFLPFGAYSIARPLSELNRDIRSDDVDPNSDALITANTPEGAHLYTGGIGDADHHGLGMVYNIVSGDSIPWAAINIFGPPGHSDPGPYPLSPLTSCQNWYWVLGYGDTPPPGAEGWPDDPHILRRTQYYDGSSVTPNVWVYYRPPVWKRQSAYIDQHICNIDRDTLKLYEIYQGWTEDGGATWQAGYACIFDLITGAMRPDAMASSIASGLPVYPLMLRYDEAAIRQQINHCLAVTMVSTLSYQAQWPARHNASGWGTLPAGARLRLKDSYYQAQKDSFHIPARAAVDAMWRYGLIVADNGPNWGLDAMADKRWQDHGPVNQAYIHELQNIPGTAFEVLRIIPGYDFTGPSTGQVGVSCGPFTITRIPAHDHNLNDVVQAIRDIFTPGQQILGSVVINDANKSGTFSFIPTAPGSYVITLYPTISYAIAPPALTVTVT